ncbi:recombinase family protein [Halorubrum vacuolatum]|nr:recombinase family protein [Halorubrum vacuolatum]
MTEQNHPLPPGIGDSDDDELGAAIYARTSSASQRFGYSIDEQISRCWDRCEMRNWTVRYVFADEAESGRDTDRPEFQSLLGTAAQDVIDVVVFWKLDRFCRSLTDLVRTKEQLDQWDVALQSVTEYIDTTTPVGRFNFRNLASAAELETDLTSQRVKMGMYGMAKHHKWPNNQPPLGYDMLDNDQLKINDTEASLVRRIYQLYIRERSMPQVAFILNKEGITTPAGNDWKTQSIQKILSNELYIGQYCVAGYEDYVNEYRIISDDLFDKVTDIRHRFKPEPMDKERKISKSERILSEYRKKTGLDE